MCRWGVNTWSVVMSHLWFWNLLSLGCQTAQDWLGIPLHLSMVPGLPEYTGNHTDEEFHYRVRTPGKQILLAMERILHAGPTELEEDDQEK